MKPRKARTPSSDNSSTYTIHHLHAKLGVSIKTLKEWERKKLIPKAKRNVFGWRVYTETELDNIEQIVQENNYFRNSNSN